MWGGYGSLVMQEHVGQLRQFYNFFPIWLLLILMFYAESLYIRNAVEWMLLIWQVASRVI